jgi:hypothetical protein
LLQQPGLSMEVSSFVLSLILLLCHSGIIPVLDFSQMKQ